MVKNLSQLKKALRAGAQFTVVNHARQECIGEQREVTYANTHSFYSIVPSNPNCRASLANNGRGSVLWWSRAPFWEFKDGVCTLYASNTKHEDKYLIISLQITKEAA